MRAFEFLTESKKVNEALAMRDYAHPEEYLVRDGVDAAIEILEEFKEDLEQPESLNVKWDGKAAVFWGRDESGEFYMVPNNQWNKGQKLSREELEGEIKRTGRKLPSQSDEEFAAVRQSIASNYSRQWKILEKSSPKQGFYWGDIMFESPPGKNSQGDYEFTPNKITYTADPKKEVGQAIEKGAELFIAVHGLVPEFGTDPTSDLKPVAQTELASINRGNPRAYLLSERPEKKSTGVSTDFIDQGIKTLSSLKSEVDSFLAYTAPRFTGFKNILRNYINNRVKARGKLDFTDFLASSKISQNQQKIAMEFVTSNQKAMQSFIKAVDIVIDTKNRVLGEIHKHHGSSMKDRLGISASVGGKEGGEGYAKIRKSGSGIKYVNPEFRSAPVNPRFGG